MSFAKLASAQVDGLEPKLVTIEIDISRGLHSFTLVGLPDKAVEESRDRVSAAIKNAGLKSPKQKNENVVISLAPAELKKTGPVFDLGIAVGYLLASGEISFNADKKIFLGELSLDGKLRPINGALAIAKLAAEEGFKEIYIPSENAKEAALIAGIKVFAPKSLKELMLHLDPASTTKNINNISEPLVTLISHPVTKLDKTHAKSRLDQRVRFDDIRGQTGAKRGLEIAAAGGHNVLLFGPPGTGKTLLAKAFSSLLPDLEFEEALEVTAIHSAVGNLKEAIVTKPPFRSPHHTSSYVSIIGGGAYPRPGEITLAHRGVLFLDEFPEFDKRVIESLREPLEERKLTVSRSQKSVSFPADVILIAAMNPCPCGNRNSDKDCRCAPKDLARYERKLSGPILDRIDLWLEVGKVETSKLHDSKNTAEDSKEELGMRNRVRKARNAQVKRFDGEHRVQNAHLGPRTLSKNIYAEDSVYELLEKAAEDLGLSARGYHKMLKISRTIADLDESEKVKDEHLLEALQYRQKPMFL